MIIRIGIHEFMRRLNLNPHEEEDRRKAMARLSTLIDLGYAWWANPQKTQIYIDEDAINLKSIYRYVKIVETRKPHTCEACGAIIPAGSKAILVVSKRHEYQRYPDRRYYHYLEGALNDPYEILTMSYNDIRVRICRHLWGEGDE